MNLPKVMTHIDDDREWIRQQAGIIYVMERSSSGDYLKHDQDRKVDTWN